MRIKYKSFPEDIFDSEHYQRLNLVKDVVGLGIKCGKSILLRFVLFFGQESKPFYRDRIPSRS